MERKLPIIVILVVAWFLSMISLAAYMKYQSNQVDAKLREIGEVGFYKAKLKAWKAGDCYVFGAKLEGVAHPVFFSNCQK